MHVLISGAGIAGPSLAWFLAKTPDAHITIVERSHTLLPHGQSVDFQGAAIKVLKKMGLMDQIRQAHTKEKGCQFIDAQGRPFAPFPITADSSVSLTSAFEILRGDLAAILYAATKDLPNVTYLFSTTINRVVSNTDTQVQVELSNGQIRAFDLLVAADGQWSKIRTQCFPAEDIATKPMGMYAVYYTIPRQPLDTDWWTIYVALRSRIITLRPDPHGTMRAMFTIMPVPTDNNNNNNSHTGNDDSNDEKTWKSVSRAPRPQQEQLVRRAFADAGWQAPRLLDAMSDAPDFYFQSIEQIRLARWSRGRVVCLGDAAYCPSPLTGMGASLALLGAYVLAGELSRVSEMPSVPSEGEKYGDVGRALEGYERVFRPFVETTQKVPGFVPGILHPATVGKRWLLQGVVGMLSWVVSFPLVGKWMGDEESRDGGFVLPEYQYLDGGSEAKG